MPGREASLKDMMRPGGVALALILLGGLLVGADAQSGRQVKISFEFRQSSTQNRDAVDGSGGVIITDRGGARSSGRVGLDSTQRRVQTSTAIFTIVQDGGESTLLVASQIPYTQVAYYHDYLSGAGYVASGVSVQGRRDVVEGARRNPARELGEGPADADYQLVFRRSVRRDRGQRSVDRPGGAEWAAGRARGRHDPDSRADPSDSRLSSG